MTQYRCRIFDIQTWIRFLAISVFFLSFGNTAHSQSVGFIENNGTIVCDQSIIDTDVCVFMAFNWYAPSQYLNNCLMFDALAGIQVFGFNICDASTIGRSGYSLEWIGVNESYIADDFFQKYNMQTRYAGTESPLYGTVVSEQALRNSNFPVIVTNILNQILRGIPADELSFYLLN